MGSRWRDFTTSLALTVLQGPEKVLALGKIYFRECSLMQSQVITNQ